MFNVNTPAVKGNLLSLAISSLIVVAPWSQANSIYLTFDDGPINATENLLQVLEDTGVKATFYVNAWHLDGIGDEHDERALQNLQNTLLAGHVVANHSYDHMIHNCVEEFGANSAAECNESEGWNTNSYQDVERDVASFAQNLAVLEQHLAAYTQLPNYRAQDIARLPYTLSWRISSDFSADAPCATVDFTGQVCEPGVVTNSGKAAIAVSNELADLGYQIHGADFNFWPVYGEPLNAEQIEFEAQTLLDYVELADTVCFPPFFGSFDYPCEHDLNAGKFVIVTHDFLFEDSYRGLGQSNRLPILQRFIELAKAAGHQFDTMDNYITPWQENEWLKAGDVRSAAGKNYRALQAHQTQAAWQPHLAHNLWALDSPSKQWHAQVNYQLNDQIEYQGSHYQVLVAHQSQFGWTPDIAVNLFQEINP